MDEIKHTPGPWHCGSYGAVCQGGKWPSDQDDICYINSEVGDDEGFADPVPQKQLQTITENLYEKAEVIADYSNVHKQQDFLARREDVLILLQRRPCSVEDIAAGLGLHRNEVVKYIEELLSESKIETKAQNQQLYYRATI